MFTQSFFLRWFRIRWYRHFYNLWLQTKPNSYLASTYLNTANALWDKMPELDRRFILLTETR